MKKLFLVIAVCFGFAMTANAQVDPQGQSCYTNDYQKGKLERSGATYTTSSNNSSSNSNTNSSGWNVGGNGGGSVGTSTKVGAEINGGYNRGSSNTKGNENSNGTSTNYNYICVPDNKR